MSSYYSKKPLHPIKIGTNPIKDMYLALRNNPRTRPSKLILHRIVNPNICPFIISLDLKSSFPDLALAKKTRSTQKSSILVIVYVIIATKIVKPSDITIQFLSYVDRKSNVSMHVCHVLWIMDYRFRFMDLQDCNSDAVLTLLENNLKIFQILVIFERVVMKY